MKTNFDRETQMLHVELTVDEAVSRGYPLPPDVQERIIEQQRLAIMTSEEKRNYLQEKFSTRKNSFLDDETAELLG